MTKFANELKNCMTHAFKEFMDVPFTTEPFLLHKKYTRCRFSVSSITPVLAVSLQSVSLQTGCIFTKNLDVYFVILYTTTLIFRPYLYKQAVSLQKI